MTEDIQLLPDIGRVSLVTDRSTLTDVNNTGGGGLFYSASMASNQNQSGWQWQVYSEHLDLFAPPLYLFALGWNEFRHRDRLRKNADQTSRSRPVRV
jgi:hypothetical protein